MKFRLREPTASQDHQVLKLCESKLRKKQTKEWSTQAYQGQAQVRQTQASKRTCTNLNANLRFTSLS